MWEREGGVAVGRGLVRWVVLRVANPEPHGEGSARDTAPLAGGVPSPPSPRPRTSCALSPAPGTHSGVGTSRSRRTLRLGMKTCVLGMNSEGMFANHGNLLQVEVGQAERWWSAGHRSLGGFCHTHCSSHRRRWMRSMRFASCSVSRRGLPANGPKHPDVEANAPE